MFEHLHAIKSREVFPGFLGRFVHSDKMTFAHWEIKKGSASPEHNHVHEQAVYMIEGQFELNIEGRKQVLSPGMMAIVPSQAKHSGKAVTDCVILDVFCPVREDYK